MDGAQRRPRQRQLGLGERPGDPEVGHADAAVARDEDVPGLHVAVDDPLVVGGLQRLRDLGGDARGLPRRERPVPPEERGQVLARDQLHDDERTLAGLARVEDLHDRGGRERCSGRGLLAEPHDEVGVAAVLRVHELHGDLAAQHRVARTPDRGHPAVADFGRPARSQPFSDRPALRHASSV